MEKKLPFTGILSNKAEENPGICVLALHTICISKRDFLLLLFHLTCITAQVLKWFWMPMLADFFNWNRVKLRYCDGASFSGDSQDEVGLAPSLV
jgi:hypothetical protein